MNTAISIKKASLPAKEVNDFVAQEKLTVDGYQASFGPLVTLSQSSGSMSFRFSMTPVDAIYMAGLLIAAAESLCPVPELDSLETVDEFGG